VTNDERRQRLRELDALLEHVERANLSEAPLPDNVAQVLTEVGVKRPRDLSPYQLVAAVWALQRPYLIELVLPVAPRRRRGHSLPLCGSCLLRHEDTFPCGRIAV
jgi:hypothetical protein